MTDVTQLIAQARDGDPRAADLLYRAVYDDLHRLAARQVARGDGGGMGRTSLVHEAYFRLARPGSVPLNDRRHFYAVAARAMRQIAVDHVRERIAAKRGGGASVVTLGAADAIAMDDDTHQVQLVALDQALEALDAVEPRLARLVELRFFGGLTLDEAGAALDLSPSTLKRDFRKARAFLLARLGEDGPLDDVGN